METEEQHTDGETVGHQEISLGDDEDEANQDNSNDGEKADVKFKGHQARQILVLAYVQNCKNVGRDIHERSGEGSADDDGC